MYSIHLLNLNSTDKIVYVCVDEETADNNKQVYSTNKL